MHTRWRARIPRGERAEELCEMIRSSSKLIAKAGSVRNINKVGYRFKFALEIEHVTKMMGSSEVVVVWERGAKVSATAPARIDKATRRAEFGGESLTQDITLFKKKKEGSDFEEKVYKLSVRQGSERGRVLGKIDINFADYVDIPSFSKKIGATLQSGAQIVLHVRSTFMGETKGKKNSRGGSSIGSSAFDQSSHAGSRDELDSRDEDLADLDVDDALPPQAPLVKASSSRIPRPGRPPRDPVDENPVSSGSLRKRPMAQSPSRTKGDEGSTSVSAPSRNAELDRLRRENRELRRKNDDLAQRNDDLEQRLDSGVDGSIEDLMIENTSLREEIGDLETRLSREPVYADVVRDLREAKMALAILTLEKDELTQHVRKLGRR